MEANPLDATTGAAEMKWTSIVDSPQILQYMIGLLFWGAIMAWAGITMHQAVRDQRKRQINWLDAQGDNWK